MNTDYEGHLHFYHANGSDSDTGSSIDSQAGFSATRYAEAEISAAIGRPHDYIRATEELRECVLLFYGRSKMSKEMRHIIEKDAAQAFLVPDRGMRPRAARLRLLSAMEKRFAKKIVKDMKKLRQQQEVQARRLKKAGALNEDIGSDMESLPIEILMQIFMVLDPFALASCMRVCKAWRTIGASDQLWQRLLHLTFRLPPNSGAVGIRPAWQSFEEMANGDMRALDWWRSGRRYANKSLTWEKPNPMRWSHRQRIAAPTVQWVARYLGGRQPWQEGDHSDSDQEWSE